MTLACSQLFAPSLIMNLLIRHKRRLRSIAGFTLIELLVIIIIVGILFAIAAPGWDAFLSRQRVSTARDQVVQAIKQTQTIAKTSRVPQIIAFRNTTDGFPESTSGAYVNSTQVPDKWQRLGENNLPSNSVAVQVTRPTSETTLIKDALVFDTSGAVAQYPLISQTADYTASTTVKSGKNGYFKVTIAKPGNFGGGAQRCVIVQTLLGATQLAEGADCNN